MPKKERIISMNKSSIPSQTINVGGDPASIANAKEQHEIIDKERSTEGIDYRQVKREADNLVVLRVNLKGKIE